MQHVESSQKIFFTNEYARFKMINGNRQLDEKKIKRIIEEISNGNDMLRYYPIQVKEKDKRLEILDGQHRFYISSKLKKPIYYIMVTENKSMHEIAKVNSNTEKWKPDDFINCYTQLGNKHYQQVQEFRDKYKISLSVSLLLLATGSPGVEQAYRDLNEVFRSGSFEVKKWDDACKIAELCKQFQKFSNWRSRPFVIAIYRIYKAQLITIDEIIAAWQQRPEMLNQQGNYKSYINVLEQIVNVRKQKRVVII